MRVVGRSHQSKEVKMRAVIFQGDGPQAIDTVCVWYKIHNGTGMSQCVFACLHFSMCMFMSLCVCIPAQSSVDLCGAHNAPC